jgi:hypothetical protein
LRRSKAAFSAVDLRMVFKFLSKARRLSGASPSDDRRKRTVFRRLADPTRPAIPKRCSAQAFTKFVLWFTLLLTNGHPLRLRLGLQRLRSIESRQNVFRAVKAEREGLEHQ